MVTLARDESLDDFEPEFLAQGKKVYRNGRGPTVRLMLTDGLPAWAPRPKPVFDASGHRPGPVRVLSDEALKDAKLAAHDARQRYIQEISDAWRTSPGGPGGAPHTTAPAAEPGSDDDDVESPRDAYIRQISTAWQRPMGQAPAASANNVAAISRNWLSPGARPGPGPGYVDAASRSTATKDADVDRETAYREYVDRISGAWRR